MAVGAGGAGEAGGSWLNWRWSVQLEVGGGAGGGRVELEVDGLAINVAYYLNPCSSYIHFQLS